jgi:hypothetical protein
MEAKRRTTVASGKILGIRMIFDLSGLASGPFEGFKITARKVATPPDLKPSAPT